MMKYIVPLALLSLLAGMASATMWLNQDPYFTDFMQPGVIQTSVHYNAPYVKPTNMSPFEIINAPFFPLLGDGFNINQTNPATVQNTTSVEGSLNVSPLPITFSGDLENNLVYAQTKSSLRVGQASGWTSMSNQWTSN